MGTPILERQDEVDEQSSWEGVTRGARTKGKNVWCSQNLSKEGASEKSDQLGQNLW